MTLTDPQRAALQMLAAAPRGYSVSGAIARGFTFAMLQDLVRAGFATVPRDAVAAGKTKIARLRITNMGRQALAK
jgi:hypothetical protein